jgi:DNA-directed RNA polymerase subunit M/transcription elongation factor TFIIS
MPIQVQALLLTASSEVKSVKITIAKEEVGCQLSDIQKYLKKKTPLQLLGTYGWKGNTLNVFGHKEGKAGTENKHELPPPLDNELCFGDIIILLCKEKKSFAKPIPFKVDDYESFYTQMFEGFEDLDEDEEGEEVFEDDDDDDLEEKEAEFEENEQPTYIEEEEETAVVEEKPEYEEEVAPVVIRKKAVKAEKVSKSKKKEAPPPFQLGEELTRELEVVPQNEKQRLQTLHAISTILTTFSEQEQKELEHHIYNASLLVADKKHITKHWAQLLFVEIYKSHSRTIIANLSPSNYVKNEALYKRYKDGSISLAEIAHLNFSDLYPEIWKELSIRQYEREKRQLEGNKSMATDQWQCKRCGKRECTYYELQTRSADEPMTIFIQCVNCGKHWRQ